MISVDPVQRISKLLGITTGTLENFIKEISASTGKNDVLDKIFKDNEEIVSKTLKEINSLELITGSHIRGGLQKTIFYHEKQFLDFLETVDGPNEFEKAANLAKSLAKVGKGFFLKKSLIKDIFLARKPENLLKYLGYETVEEMFQNNIDLTEAFSALRFVEADEWMHETFDEAYSKFTAEDFEEREIEIKTLRERWHDIAKKFIEKKHHNVSHLKEFGIIFLNPIKMDIPGKFLRDFALLLHYFHEIEFYSKLFKKYSTLPDFAFKLEALLRGDVKELTDLKQKNNWLIVQRYLVKDNPQDPRLFAPRVNPESIHWTKAERDLIGITEKSGGKVNLSIWLNLDWVGGVFEESAGDTSSQLGTGEIVSFDLEDNAMSLVAVMEGKRDSFTYHQREAMWTRIFSEYAGGEEKLDEMILESFDKGFITL